MICTGERITAFWEASIKDDPGGLLTISLTKLVFYVISYLHGSTKIKMHEIGFYAATQKKIGSSNLTSYSVMGISGLASIPIVITIMTE